MFVNKYPYTDFHELNADMLIETVNDAASTAASMNTRVTTLESDVAPIKAAFPTMASDVSGLKVSMGQVNDLISDQILPAVESVPGIDGRVTDNTEDIGSLDERVTALENQPSTGGITEYLRFSTGGTPYDYDSRITYDYLANLIATTASADKNYNIILVEDDEVGTTWYYTLNEGKYQVSAGTPRGAFIFTCRKPVLDDNDTVTGYNVCTVTVDRNASTPTFSEVYESVIPAATSADAGKVLTVGSTGEWAAKTPGGVEGAFVQGGGVNYDFAKYIEYDDHILVNIRGTVTSPLNAGATLLTGGPIVTESSNAVGVIADNNNYNPLCVAYTVNGSVVSRPSLSVGSTFYISIVVMK